MIPQPIIDAAESPFFGPRNAHPSMDGAYDYGGVGLNNTSQGLLVKRWRLRWVDGDFIIDAPGVAPSILFSAEGVTGFDLTFDQNMNPFVAYTAGDGSWFRWFDPIEGGYVITALDGITPRCALDDKRQFNAGNSDIILSYVRGGGVRYRLQRERYGIEHTAQASGALWLKQAGMSVGNTFQWEAA